MHGIQVPALDPASTTGVAALMRDAPLSEAARVRLRADPNARQLIDELGAAGSHGDALKVLARVLPRQYALAWACECVRRFLVPGSPTHDIDRAGLALAEGWLREPSEDNRRAALEFAERGAYESVGAWIAAACAWSEGSIAPAGYAAVPPAEHLAADALAAALAFLAAQSPEEIPARQAAFVQRALSVFGGRERVSEPVA